MASPSCPVRRDRRSMLEPEGGLTALEVEAAALTTMQAHAAAEGWKERFTKAKIQSNEWTILRPQESSVVVGRDLGIWAYAEWTDPLCPVLAPACWQCPRPARSPARTSSQTTSALIAPAASDDASATGALGTKQTVTL
jgi:hypothetical protein